MCQTLVTFTPSQSPSSVDISQLVGDVPAFRAELAAAKAQLAPPEWWYPYDTLGNVDAIDRRLSTDNRDLGVLAGGRPVADIGGGDGDLAFLLARHGFAVDIIDWGPTNWNGLAGARLLADHFATTVEVHEVNLDSQFAFPRAQYRLVFFLGILYHLQNPFYVLRALAERADHVLLSTRVARVTADGEMPLDAAPIAYLVAPTETNGDPTNFWIFSPTGLRRLCERTGWDVVDEAFSGRTEGDSDPSSQDRDERAFLLLRRRHGGDEELGRPQPVATEVRNDLGMPPESMVSLLFRESRTGPRRMVDRRRLSAVVRRFRPDSLLRSAGSWGLCDECGVQSAAIAFLVRSEVVPPAVCPW
jgi:tRNA (mo5U34)-methyltransferase